MAHGSLHQFKALLERKQARKNKSEGKFDKTKLDYSSSNAKTEFDFPELPETELENLKKKIRAEIKTGKRKDFIIFLCVLGLLFMLFLVLTY